MDATGTVLIEDAEKARAAISPLRRLLLGHLRQPGSASSLAAVLGMSRQKLGHHLRALEAAGLIEGAGERKKRGFVERLLVAKAEAFVIDPAILGRPAERIDKQDRYAAAHLVAVASETVREVTRMQAAADAENTRLLTFTIEADVRFGAPADIERFTTRLAEAIAGLAGEFAPADGAGRKYSVLVGGHPAVGGKLEPKVN